MSERSMGVSGDVAASWDRSARVIATDRWNEILRLEDAGVSVFKNEFFPEQSLVQWDDGSWVMCEGRKRIASLMLGDHSWTFISKRLG